MRRIWIILLAVFMMATALSCASKETPATEQKYQLKKLPASPMVAASFFKASETTEIIDPISPDDPNVMEVWLIERTTGRQASTPLLLHKTRGIIQWTPATGDEGVYGVRVTASDGKATSEPADFLITVLPANKPPYIFAKMERINNGLQSKSPILRGP